MIGRDASQHDSKKKESNEDEEYKAHTAMVRRRDVSRGDP